MQYPERALMMVQEKSVLFHHLKSAVMPEPNTLLNIRKAD